MMPASTEFPRRFVPTTMDPADFSRLQELFEALLQRPIHSAAELESWLLDHSELGAVCGQQAAQRYIAMTCHTDDADAEKAYLHWIEQIQPRCMPYWQRLDQRYLESPYRHNLPAERYRVFDRNTAADVARFRQENIPLQTEEAKLDQQYNKICGALSVHFDGRDQTLPQMAKYQESSDRTLRQSAWLSVMHKRLEHRETFDQILDSQIALRHQMARQAGQSDYTHYAFQMYHRFDYTPEDCDQFRRSIQQIVVPRLRQELEERRLDLGTSSLRPWDLEVDPRNHPPLRPFEQVEGLCQRVETLFERLDPELARQFHIMRQEKLLDLESRPGKAPGGYQYTLEEVRKPFIFMNAAGLHDDLETLLHESGHAFHAWASRNEPLLAYRSAPMEFCEVASMSMELIGLDYLAIFYNPEQARRAARKSLEGILRVLPWIAQIDSFQRWMYAHPHHSQAERYSYWLELDEALGGSLDWSSLETEQKARWQMQRHLWGNPLYYIEYGIAQLGALQLWQRFRQNPADALAAYRRALALGGSRPLPELFAAAGIRFDFGPDLLEPLMVTLQAALDDLEE